MRNATGYWRWLLVLAVALGFAGSAYAQRTVTLRLNTATLADTLAAHHDVQVRGCLVDCTDNQSELPGGNVIAWDARTTLRPENTGGDYWETTFEVPDDQELRFKFYAQLPEDNGIGGWEDGGDHILAAGTGDTTMTLHFYEKGADKPYDWRPFEIKEDSVAVYFRVAMYGEETRQDGYNPDLNDPEQRIGVRGDNMGGVSPIDWGATNLVLEREGTNANQTAYRLYSGVAYYPKSAEGQTQNYKFVMEQGASVDYEEGNVVGNRQFNIPSTDTTLYWVFYGNTAPSSVDPVESLVIFQVDLSPLEEIGLFDRGRGDTLWVYGSFNGWQDCPTQNPDLCLMSAVPGENQFELAAPLSQIPGQTVSFKYFLDFNNETFQEAFGMAPPSGWEEGHATGTNRTFTYEDSPEHLLDLAYYNDITPADVINQEGTIAVHFSVDMTPALSNQAQPFNPAAGDSVTIRVNDPVWAFTQGIVGDPRSTSDFPLFINEFVLTDPDGDNVYTGTLMVDGPTYAGITFRYAYGQGATFFEDVGTGPEAPGRNRVHYIKPNPDGSWPAEYTLPAHTFKIDAGPLPFESNPNIVGVEEVDGEVPHAIALGQNYPNPFNPSTAFEYSLNATQHVSVRVYDLLGRVVATLVDGVQPASTYRVTFDAAHLASGVYIYQLQTPNQVLTKKMLLVK